MGKEQICKTVIVTVSFKENPKISCDLQLWEDIPDETRTWRRLQNAKNLQVGAERGMWGVAISGEPVEGLPNASCLFIGGDSDSFYPFAGKCIMSLYFVAPYFLNFIPPSTLSGRGLMYYVDKNLLYTIRGA